MQNRNHLFSARVRESELGETAPTHIKGCSMKRVIFSILALVLWVGSATAQTWPTHALRLVVPYPPGGGTDLVARAVAAKLADGLGQPVVVDNRGGAGGTIGTDIVAKAAPDGYTIGIANLSTHATSAVLQKNLPFDPIKSFAPISLIGSASFVLLGSPALPVSTLPELVAYARANPNKLNMASTGSPTLSYLLGLQFKQLTGTQMVDVAYKGSSQIYPDLMSNQVSLYFDNPGASTPLVNSGRLKAFGVSSPTPAMLGVPLISQAGASVGLKELDSTFWWGLVAPAGTPRPIIDRMQAEVAKYAQSADGKKELGLRGLETWGSTPEEFAGVMQRDISRLSALTKQLGIQPQ
jgi:tripartite-type tricarboxylate transporter receptor subunit TctC